MAGLCSAYRPQPGAEPDSADGLRGPRREGSDPHRLGDDGAEGSLWGILPVMQLFAEASWEPAADENRLAARFAACTGLCWTDFLAIDQLHLRPGDAPDTPGPANPAKYLLYQDVLLGLFDAHVPEERDAPVFAAAADAMRAAALRNPQTALFETLEKLAAVLACKADLGAGCAALIRRGQAGALPPEGDSAPPAGFVRGAVPGGVPPVGSGK